MNCREVKPGDVINRLLSGIVPMQLRVTSVDDRLIHCGGESGWTFDRTTGAEIDEDLGWDNSMTGSYIESWFSPDSAV